MGVLERAFQVLYGKLWGLRFYEIVITMLI